MQQVNHESKILWLKSQGRLVLLPRWMSEPQGEQVAIFSSRCGNYAHRGIGDTQKIAIDEVCQDIKRELERILFK